MNPETGYDGAAAGWFSGETPDRDADALGFPRTTGGDPEAISRVRDWIRDRFKLPDDSAIMVSEVACNLPGCPPLETVVAFWEDGTRHHFKLFKPVAEVTSDNLPYAWMKESLIVPEGFGCECC